MSKKATCLLPDSVIPNHYNLELKPNFETFTFEGVVSINISILSKTREIKLHAAGLEILASGVRLWSDAAEPIVPNEVVFNKKEETATFVFENELPVSTVILEVTYTGTLGEKPNGFYRSKYVGSSGETRYLATTQFEATDARRALPCFDEPARKAPFNVTLVVPKNMTALSNMPVGATYRLGDGTKKVIFDPSPVMSTYLLAFIIGELEYIETISNTTRIRVYTVPGKSAHGVFALDVAKRVLEFYGEYFDIPYQLPKLDMVAIPDFAAGAMENWGLVTYRENALLVDPANSSTLAHQRVAEVVAHELAHQWFGNLVTMQWWDNLWLNEGFATAMEVFALNVLFPEWDLLTQFVAKEYASALSLDSLRSTHPIEVEVNHPDEISQIFDAISYSKGASIIRMIHDHIGADAFRRGLQIYLKRHAYGNATTEDLWAALEEASGQPVREIMDTWTKQPGYPLVTLSPDWPDLKITQRRFLANGSDLTEEERAQRWKIPLAYSAGLDAKSFTGKKLCGGVAYMPFQMSPGVLKSESLSHLKLNTGQTALVRVNYSPVQWALLARALREGKLSPVDRYGILSDTFALVRAGYLPITQLFDLLRGFANEENYSVWFGIFEVLDALQNILEETREERKFALFARNLLRPIADKLGWNGSGSEAHTIKLLRGPVLGALGYYAPDEVMADARVRFQHRVSGDEHLDPDLRAAVYNIAARYGDQETFESLTYLYEKESLQEEKVRLLNAMGKFVDPTPLHTAIGYAFNSGKVRPSDFGYLLSALGGHTTGRRMTWGFIQNNWEVVNERYSGGGLMMLSPVIEYACGGFAQSADADVIESFFANHPVPSATRAVAKVLERIRLRAAWYERDKEQIISALS